LCNTVEGKFSLSSRVEESRLYFDYLRDRGLDLPYRFPHEDPAFYRKLATRVSEYADEDYVDTFLTTRAVRIIEDSGRCPFFMQLGLCSPHHFYDPPQEYLDLYDGVDIPDPVFDPQATAQRSPSFRRFQADVTDRHELPREDWDEATLERLRRLRRHYLATVTCVDRQVGRVVDALKAKGIYENTAILFVSDHGEFTGDHGCVDKHLFMYECNVHVPLVVHAPFLGHVQARADGLVQNLDLFATILALGGVDPPGDVAARSLLPMLAEPNHPGRDVVIAQSADRIMLRKGHHKLVRDAEFVELYDLAQDPWEQHNLAPDPTHRERVLAMTHEIVNLMVETETRCEDDIAPGWRPYLPSLRDNGGTGSNP